MLEGKTLKELGLSYLERYMQKGNCDYEAQGGGKCCDGWLGIAISVSLCNN